MVPRIVGQGRPEKETMYKILSKQTCSGSLGHMDPWKGDEGRRAILSQQGDPSGAQTRRE